MTDMMSERVTPAGDVASTPRTRRTSAWFVLGQSVLIAACLFMYVRGWDRDFSVPFRFADDSLVAVMQSKSTIDNGWWWFNPRIGVPFGLDLLQFPANSNIDQAIVWTVSRVVGDAATAVNVAWMVMVILSGLSATWCMRRLGVSATSALVAGTLFALTPHVLIRNINHLWLVIYLVPFVCTAALLLATGRVRRWYWGRSFLALLAGCGLIGFNYIYYAFFGCFILIVASVVGALHHRASHLLGAGAVCLVLIGGGTFLNLAPSFHSWNERGRPLVLHEKSPAESEVYGLKIRQLVSPTLWHRFPPFHTWLEREQTAAFPLETENASSRLGVVGALGFLTLLGLLFVPRVCQRLDSGALLLAGSRLTLAAVLLATIGGFGSLFSLLVAPEIRAYTRISPFIVFFSLTAVALLVDAFFTSRNSRVVAAVVIAVVGLADQRAAAVHMNSVHKGIAAEMMSLRSFVGELETRLPPGSMVFQLPLRMYLDDPGIERMRPYDHLKMYAASRTLRWSYPALSNQQVRWQQSAALLEPPQLARELASEGFSAILIDRAGYSDNGAAIEATLQDQSERPEILSETSRYVVFDIRPLASTVSAASVLSRAADSRPATVGLDACADQTLFHIDRIGSARAPFGDEPLRLKSSTDVKVTGWAVDRSAETTASGMDVLLDQMAFQAIYGVSRPDVAGHFEQPAYLQSGFLAAIPVAQLDRGRHTLSLRIVAADRRCYYQTPPQIVVVD